MDDPTCENGCVEKIDLSSSQYIKFSASVDDRGRISIPSRIVKIIGKRYVSLSYKFLNDRIVVSNILIGSKNRISIPSFVRKTLAINSYEKIELAFFDNCIFILKNGRGCVVVARRPVEPSGRVQIPVAALRGDKNG